MCFEIALTQHMFGLDLFHRIKWLIVIPFLVGIGSPTILMEPLWIHAKKNGGQYLWSLVVTYWSEGTNQFLKKVFYERVSFWKQSCSW